MPNRATLFAVATGVKSSVRVMCDQMQGEFYQNMAEMEGSCALGGYDEEFVEDIEDDWLCPICHLPLKVSVLTEVCGHRFCKLCLERHFMR